MTQSENLSIGQEQQLLIQQLTEEVEALDKENQQLQCQIHALSMKLTTLEKNNQEKLNEVKTINEMIDRIKLKDIELNKVTTELSSLKSKMAIEKRNHRRANRLIILLVAIIIIIIAI